MTHVIELGIDEQGQIEIRAEGAAPVPGRIDLPGVLRGVQGALDPANLPRILVGSDAQLARAEARGAEVLGAVWDAPIASVFSRQRGRAEAEGADLVLLIHATGRAADLPWELLPDPAGIGLESSGVPIARLGPGAPPRPGPRRSAGRSLWTATPDDPVVARVCEAIRRSDPGIADADTPAALLHLVSHAEPMARALSVAGTASSSVVHGLSHALREASLVVLHLCDGATGGAMALQLLGLGVPAAVAPAGPLGQDAAAAFAQGLAPPGTVARGVAEGRRRVAALASPYPDQRWWRLQLWVQSAAAVAQPLDPRVHWPTSWPTPAPDLRRLWDTAVSIATRMQGGFIGIEHLILAEATGDDLPPGLGFSIATSQARILDRLRALAASGPPPTVPVPTPRLATVLPALPDPVDRAGLWRRLREQHTEVLGFLLGATLGIVGDHGPNAALAQGPRRVPRGPGGPRGRPPSGPGARPRGGSCRGSAPGPGAAVPGHRPDGSPSVPDPPALGGGRKGAPAPRRDGPPRTPPGPRLHVARGSRRRVDPHPGHGPDRPSIDPAVGPGAKVDPGRGPLLWREYEAQRRTVAVTAVAAAEALRSGDRRPAAAMLAPWSLGPFLDAAVTVLQERSAHPPRPSPVEGHLALSDALAIPQPELALPRWAHRERVLAAHSGSVGGAEGVDGLAWALARLWEIGHDIEARRFAPWSDRTYRPDPILDPEVECLWRTLMSDDPWPARRRWEALFLGRAEGAVVAVLRGSSIPEYRRQQILADVREGFFYAMLGGSARDAGWAELGARVLETVDPHPIAALSWHAGAEAWRLVARCVVDRGHMQRTAVRAWPHAANGTGRAWCARRILPRHWRAFVALHVLCRVVDRWDDPTCTDTASTWRSVVQNLGRARGRLRAVLIQTGPRTGWGTLGRIAALHARTRTAIGWMCRDWAQRQLTHDAPFDLQGARGAACNAPSLPWRDEYRTEARRAASSWLVLVALRGRWPHLRRWSRDRSHTGRDTGFGRLLTDAPASLVDVEGGRRAYHRLRAYVSSDWSSLQRGVLRRIRSVADLDPDTPNLRDRFEACLLDWHADVPFPRVRYRDYIDACRTLVRELS